MTLKLNVAWKQGCRLHHVFSDYSFVVGFVSSFNCNCAWQTLEWLHNFPVYCVTKFSGRTSVSGECCVWRYESMQFLAATSSTVLFVCFFFCAFSFWRNNPAFRCSQFRAHHSNFCLGPPWPPWLAFFYVLPFWSVWCQMLQRNALKS